jgi:hypothetical protein
MERRHTRSRRRLVESPGDPSEEKSRAPVWECVSLVRECVVLAWERVLLVTSVVLVV